MVALKTGLAACLLSRGYGVKVKYPTLKGQVPLVVTSTLPHEPEVAWADLVTCGQSASLAAATGGAVARQLLIGSVGYTEAEAPDEVEQVAVKCLSDRGYRAINHEKAMDEHPDTGVTGER